jgi:transposase
MPRSYTKMREMEDEIIATHNNGLSIRETAEHYGLKPRQIENLINRHNRRKKKIESGNPPKRKGRPRTRPLTTDEEKDYEIKRLTMENELLRDFLRLAGRR